MLYWVLTDLRALCSFITFCVPALVLRTSCN